MRALGEFRATFGVKRIYDPPADDDGFRVLELRAHTPGSPSSTLPGTPGRTMRTSCLITSGDSPPADPARVVP